MYVGFRIGVLERNAKRKIEHEKQFCPFWTRDTGIGST